MAIGTLAGSGTLGLLIPPSIIMIVYATATDQSIARLFIAGVMPGVMLAGLFMGFIVVWALFNKQRMPPRRAADAVAQRVAASRRLIPVMLLILGVIGSIYGGLASATEAAVVGVFLVARAVVVDGNAHPRELQRCAARRDPHQLHDRLHPRRRGLPHHRDGLHRHSAQRSPNGSPGFGLPHWQLLTALTLFYILLGCFLDGISMVVLTTSIIIPLVEKAGFDLIWFGIYIVLVVEMAQITPPVGFNLYVLQGMTGRNIFTIGAIPLPFFVLMCVAVALLAMFPQIALWLPSTMFDR